MSLVSGSGCVMEFALGKQGGRPIVGFGCAGLYKLASGRERSAVLSVAYEEGIRHFDVAPMYGLGRAEPELRRWMGRKRSELTIATKFGILPSAVGLSLGYVQGPARTVLSQCSGLGDRAREAAAGPAAGWAGRLLYSSPGYGAIAARRGLDRSLRALGTDYIDVLLLHDPGTGDVPTAEVGEFLEGARRAGKIRSWGVAGDPAPMLQLASEFKCRMPTLQVRHDMFSGPRPYGAAAEALIVFGVLGRATRRISKLASEDAATRRQLDELIGIGRRADEALAALLLEAAARDSGARVVLFSSTQPRRVRAAVTALAKDQAAQSEELDRFLRIVESASRATVRSDGGRR